MKNLTIAQMLTIHSTCNINPATVSRRIKATERRRRAMQKYTSGPWIVDGDEHSVTGGLTGIYISQNGGGRIGQVFGNCMVNTDDELRANAALFAAAPSLLNTPEYINDLNNSGELRNSEWKFAMDRARIAIRNARSIL